MKVVVVDASVAVKWFIPEDGAAEADALLAQRTPLIAPALLWIEVASVLWKLARRGALPPEAAEGVLAASQRYPVEIVDTAPLLGEALRLALATGATVYDALYLAAAIAHDGTLVTADQRLADVIKAEHRGRVRLLPPA